MKKSIVFSLFAVAIITMAVGCINPNPKPSPEPPKSDTDSVIVIVNDTNHVTVYDTVSVTPPPDPEEEIQEPMPTKMDFYTKMLEYFCQRFYEDEFNNEFIKGSIVIGKPEIIDPNQEVRITGTHNYKKKVGATGLIKKEQKRKPFKATVLRTEDEEYEITFERTEKGDNTCKTITYP